MSLKRRIRTVQNTSQITKAMSLVAAGQTNKVKSILSHYYNYHDLSAEIMSHLAYSARSRFDEREEFITLDREVTIKAVRAFTHQAKIYSYPALKKDLYVIITSDRGLCGSFNSSLIKFFKERVGDKKADIIMIGKKGFDILSRDKFYTILEDNYLDSNIKYIKNDIVIGKFTKKILERIGEGYDKVFLLYNSFVTMLKQEITIKQIFPILVPLPNKDRGLYSFESNPMVILAHFIPHYLHNNIYQPLLHSIRSETAKRMMSMDQASENSKEMLESLKLQYNRQRQAKVTKELIEVISGISD